MGGPLLLLAAIVVLILLPTDVASSHGTAREIAVLVLAGVFGCRIAYHLHMRKADAYEGANTDPDTYRRARMRYWIACVAYSAIAIYLAHLAVEA